MCFQRCVFCKEIFQCNCNCGAKSFSVHTCICLDCKKKENKNKSSKWKRDWIEHDPCQRRKEKI